MPICHERLSSRLKPEEDTLWSPYKLDVERIIHSKAFARYTDKTQVVYLVDNDHVTHRSLHVQFVSSFARGIAEKLGLQGDLVEAISLGHDVGHPPFGHEGEGYLSELTVEVGLGAFSHASHSCRLFREIEPLNLTFATFDGFLCHDGGMRQSTCAPKFDKSWDDHFTEIKKRTIEPEKDFVPSSLEGALVKFCDTISYLAKDLEDGISLGIIKREEIPQTVLGHTNEQIIKLAGLDLLQQSQKQKSIALSDEIFQALKTLRKFNFERIYTYPPLKVESNKIRTSYRLLFENLLLDHEKKGEQSCLWKNFLHSRSHQYITLTPLSQQVVDFISGMTDNYFISTLQKLIVPQEICL